MSETHNNHAFTNRATEYGKRMDEIEAYVKRQQKFDLANDIILNSDYKNWTLDNLNSDEIKIEAKRIEDVPGTHVINYNSEVDA